MNSLVGPPPFQLFASPLLTLEEWRRPYRCFGSFFSFPSFLLSSAQNIRPLAPHYQIYLGHDSGIPPVFPYPIGGVPPRRFVRSPTSFSPQLRNVSSPFFFSQGLTRLPSDFVTTPIARFTTTPVAFRSWFLFFSVLLFSSSCKLHDSP